MYAIRSYYDSNGTFCDIASSALDIDVGDNDGDFALQALKGLADLSMTDGEPMPELAEPFES